MRTTIISKVCSKCRVEKEIKHFYLNPQKMIYESWCSECKNQYKQHHRIRSKVKINEYQKKWYSKNKNLKSKYNNKDYSKHKSRIKLYQKLIRNKKLCCKCKTWKSKNEYYTSTKTKDGLFELCKSCCDTHTNNTKIDTNHYKNYFSKQGVKEWS